MKILNKNAARGMAVFTSVIILAGIANADPISIQVTGTADSNMLGYTAGNSYSFTWVINENFINNGSSYSEAELNYWVEELEAETPIFTDVFGDGLTGSLTRSVVTSFDPLSYVGALKGGPQTFDIYAGQDAAYGIGLQADGADLVLVRAEGLQLGEIFTFSGTYSDPIAYFTSLIGSYTPASGFGTVEVMDVAGNGVTFTPTNVAVIPEPSVIALIALCGGGLIAGRRIFMI